MTQQMSSIFPLRFAAAMIYIGFTFDAANPEGGINPFLGLAQTCLWELPALALGQLGTTRFGRRPTLLAAMAATTAASFAILATPAGLISITGLSCAIG